MKQAAAKQQLIRDEDVSDTDPTMPLPALSHLLEESDTPARPAPPVQNGETSLTADLTLECMTRLIELMDVMTQSVEKIAVMLEQQSTTTPARSPRATKKKTTKKKTTRKKAARKSTAKKPAARKSTGRKAATKKTTTKKTTRRTASTRKSSSKAAAEETSAQKTA